MRSGSTGGSSFILQVICPHSARQRRKGERLYSLAYKLVDCEKCLADGAVAERFGEYGIIGNQAKSEYFPTNNAKLVLMSLRFRCKHPITRVSRIRKELRFPRYLDDDDTQILDEYATRIRKGKL